MVSLFSGETIAFLNLTDLVGSNGSILAAGHNKSNVVRSASVANKFKVITILLYSDHNKTAVHFNLKAHTGNESITFDVCKIPKDVNIVTYLINHSQNLNLRCFILFKRQNSISDTCLILYDLKDKNRSSPK